MYKFRGLGIGDWLNTNSQIPTKYKYFKNICILKIKIKIKWQNAFVAINLINILNIFY